MCFTPGDWAAPPQQVARTDRSKRIRQGCWSFALWAAAARSRAEESPSCDSDGPSQAAEIGPKPRPCPTGLPTGALMTDGRYFTSCACSWISGPASAFDTGQSFFAASAC
jgi:hypothetical protein